MRNRHLLPAAIAYIRGGSQAPELQGTVKFYQHSDGTLVTAEIWGLPKDSESGFYALHIHEGKTCDGEDFSGTQGHYNPQNTLHPRHAGDLPPLLQCGGKAYLAVLTGRFSAAEVIGRTVVIHAGKDDFSSQSSGNAGQKIACGVIHRGRK